MTRSFAFSSLGIVAVTTALTACGPETNSRYGDEYWDPQKTWETAQVISQPDLNIVYRDTGDSPDTWAGYVSVDFSDLTLKSEGSVVLSFTTGNEEPRTVGDLVQAGSDLDTKFFYDSTNLIDYRLLLDEPGVYTFYLDFAVRQPNGTLRVYNYSWGNVTLPGQISRDDYYARYVNSNLNDNCNSCHGGGNADANAAFPMNNSSVANLRTSLINEVNNMTAGQELPGFAFDSDHVGQGNASNMTSLELETFNTFINALIQRKADGANITTNLTDLITVPVPTVMENDPYE